MHTTHIRRLLLVHGADSGAAADLASCQWQEQAKLVFV